MSTTPMMDRELNRSWAVQPLTCFDTTYSGCGVVIGWLVEGQIDTVKLEAALTRLTTKWRMLAGRLEHKPPTPRTKNLFQIRIPLGRLPAGHRPFVLTTSTSHRPISHYAQLPLPVVSEILPKELFLDASAPRVHNDWVKHQLPLTYWHVTHFEPEEKGQSGYSCVGVTFSHGLFDGLGISFVIHALEAEMAGKDWEVPPQPHGGLNENAMIARLDKTAEEVKKKNIVVEYFAISVIGVWGVVLYLLFHAWECYWNGASRKMVLVPAPAYKLLVDETRKALADSGKTDVRVSTGDTLAAWVLKTIHTPETASPSSKIGLTNMASVRTFFEDLKDYPHNCFVPMPYPCFTVAELTAMPLHDLAYALAKARSSLSAAIPVEAYHRFETNLCSPKGWTPVIPQDSRADAHLTMSNVSIGRTVDVNWRGVGAGRTLGRYKEVIGMPFLLTNLVTISGRLDTGSTVLDVVFSKKRMRVLEEALAALIARSSA